jgi:hypothetical protein
MAPAAIARSSLRHTYPQSTGTRRGTGLILAYTFFSFLLNSHPGEDINDYDHHGDLLVGLGWAGSDRILVWLGGFGLSVLGE